MREYAFPSGHVLDAQVLDVQELAGMMLRLNLLAAALLIGAICLLTWRCRRPVTLWDIPFWIGVFIANFVLAGWFKKISPSTTPDVYFILAFLLTLITSTISIAVTIIRKVKSPVFTSGIILFLVVVFAILLLLPAVQQTREAARRTQCKNNLKQIGLAVMNYYDSHTYFPPAGMAERQSGFSQSWRVSLLGYLEAIPWHDYYHFDEPWDSPFNAKVPHNFRPTSFECPTHSTKKPYSAYAMLTGKGTFGGDGLTKLSIDDITDGLANTIMIVEACGREIIWTEPRDVEVNAESLGVNLSGDKRGHSRGVISSYHSRGAHVLMGDGTVRYLSEKIDNGVLKALTTIDGRETLPQEW